MELQFVPPDLEQLDAAGAEVVVCTAWLDQRPCAGLAGLLDWRLAGRISRLLREEFAHGALGEVLCVPGRPRLPFDKVLVLGLGERARFDADAFRIAVERLCTTLEGLHVRRAVVELPGRADDAIAPELAAELALARIGASPVHDAWWLVESATAEQRILAWEKEDRLRRRSPSATA
jgi:hypothetical protein